MEKIRYSPIYRNDLIHPFESDVTLQIQKSGIVNTFAAAVGSLLMQVKTLPKMIHTGYPVNARTAPRVWAVYMDVLSRLNCDQVYDLYIDFSYELKASTYGSEKDGHIIVLNSSCIEELDNSELAALLGHEIGHIMADHIQYYQLLSLAGSIINLPLNDLIKKGLYSFFAKWMIASEFTADRASLIASGSITSVLSLLGKQSGNCEGGISVQHILSQETQPVPENPGVFYILAAETLPSFGMVARMQELVRWTCSKEFEKKQPYLYYLGKSSLGMDPESEEEGTILLLHKRSAQGNAVAAAILGERYLVKDEVLPPNPTTAVSLLTYAANAGNARALYLLSRCVHVNLAYLHADSKLEAQLLRAAASRDPAYQVFVKGLPQQATYHHISVICKDFIQANPNPGKCKVNRTLVGCALDHDEASYVQNAFWMCQNDPVYFVETKQVDGEWYGLAIAQTGLYGRIDGSTFPFHVDWKTYFRNEVTLQKKKGIVWICCGNQMITQCNNDMRGTIADALVRIHKHSQNSERK